MEQTSKAPQIPPILKMLFDVNVLEPTRIFDNLGYVGYRGVGAIVLNTSEGIILIDSMWQYSDGKDVIVPGIRKLGWDPADIKYVVISHGHADHFGSARYFEDEFGAKIFITKVDWNLMKNPNIRVMKDPFGNASNKIPQPTKYTEIKDRQKLTLGDTTMTVLSTPGHTPGCASFIIPVTDNGVSHKVAVWGGTALPRSLEETETYLQSLNYFEFVTDLAGVDAEISIHPFVNNLLEKINAIQTMKPGDPNPVVIGKEAFKQYLDVGLRQGCVERIAQYKKQ